MDIQAIFFDMGGTIETFNFTHALRLESTGLIRNRLLEAGIEISLANEQFLDVIIKGLERYKRWSIQTLDELEPLRVWNEFVLTDWEIPGDRLAPAAEELSFIIETQFYQRCLRPEVPAVLKALKQLGYKIGLISNVNSRGQVPASLNAYGIYHYFDPIVLSSEFGRRKPDPAIFHYAARLANVPTSACVYIGDRILRDIDGAKRAGFNKAIQIRHDFAHGENDIGAIPDAVISSMAELVEILKKSQAASNSAKPPGQIRALVFDAGDTLYHRRERGVRFAAFLRELGKEIDPNHRQWKKALEFKAYRGQVSTDEYRTAMVQMYDIHDPEQLARGKQALVEDDDNITFFEGVTETLLALKEQGYLLAIITDTANSISTKLAWFERGGFGHVWDAIISSMDYGVRKPDPTLYNAALKQLGLAAEQAYFIGHRTSELEGARAVGMHTVAFNQDKDATADIVINKFSDLLKLTV